MSLRSENEMEARDFVHPSEYDVLLSDVGHNELIGPIADMLEVNYLEEQQEIKYSPKDGINGILYGTNARPMINLVVSSTKFKKPINIIFLLDTGSPCVYICEEAMKKLGFHDHFPSVFTINVGEIRGRHEAIMSGKDGHYSDLNLIGATFLSKIMAKIVLDYETNTCQLITNSIS